MPKVKKIAVKTVKSKKQKLSPAERSQIAKDRWAKRRAVVEEPIAGQEKTIDAAGPPPPTSPNQPPHPQNPTPEQPPVAPESGRDENGVPSIVGLGDGTVLPNGAFVPDHPPSAPAVAPVLNLIPDPAPQLTPVKAPKQKRYTGPKEFSVALKAAEARLAKAIVERAETAGKLAALQAEIPSLLGIINALKGSGSYTSPAPVAYGTFPAEMPILPQLQPQYDPLAAINGAAAAPPVSRASGGAVQFGPEVLGALEGPEDDDLDKFITGPAAGGSGWIGG